MLKAPFVTVVLICTLCACTSPTPSTHKLLTETEAVALASEYVKQQGWHVDHIWTSRTLINGEWGIFFDLVGIGGPRIVYIHEQTRVIRFEQGL